MLKDRDNLYNSLIVNIMSITDASLASICEQRRRQMLYNVPQIRMNLLSPYPTYNQRQLDMRRKAEILKYSNTISTTKTNNLTKKQKWAQLAAGMSQTKSYTTLTGYAPDASGVYQLYMKKMNNKNCPNDGLIPTPTSSCDVPGPITYLIRDESVPLYNYVSPTSRTYAISKVENRDEWNVYINNDNKSSSGVETSLFTLYITSKISQYSYTYNFQIPIAIYITGTDINYSSLEKNIYLTDNTFNISSVGLSVYYNNSRVTLQKPPVAYLSNGSIAYDLVNNPSPVINYDVSFTPIYTTDNIALVTYSGILNVSDLFLYVEPGYIYDIKATFYVTNQFGNSAFTTTIKSYDYGVYTNISQNNSLVEKNIVLPTTNPYPIPSVFPTFTFNGI